MTQFHDDDAPGELITPQRSLLATLSSLWQHISSSRPVALGLIVVAAVTHTIERPEFLRRVLPQTAPYGVEVVRINEDLAVADRDLAESPAFPAPSSGRDLRVYMNRDGIRGVTITADIKLSLADQQALHKNPKVTMTLNGAALPVSRRNDSTSNPRTIGAVAQCDSVFREDVLQVHLAFDGEPPMLLATVPLEGCLATGFAHFEAAAVEATPMGRESPGRFSTDRSSSASLGPELGLLFGGASDGSSE